VKEGEHTFLVGALVPIGSLPPQITPAEEDEVEFVSPRVPGRMVRMVEGYERPEYGEPEESAD
jgi:hypothetical protein